MPTSHHESFIIRLNLEFDSVTLLWAFKGQIEQPQTGQMRRFSSVYDLPYILSVWLDDWLGGFPTPRTKP